MKAKPSSVVVAVSWSSQPNFHVDDVFLERRNFATHSPYSSFSPNCDNLTSLDDDPACHVTPRKERKSNFIITF